MVRYRQYRHLFAAIVATALVVMASDARASGHAPTLDSISNLTVGVNSGPQLVNLTGISSGAPNENQTLTVTTSSLAAGDRLCLQTTGTTGWTGGTGIGTVTVFLAPS